jgi:hypothetical protein
LVTRPLAIIVTALLLLSGYGVASATGIAGQADGGSDDIWGHLDDRRDEAGVTGEDSTVQISHDASSSSSIRVQVAWTPTCDLNTPDNADGMCPAARACPSTPQDNPQVRMWRWMRYWDRAAFQPVTSWEVVATRCMSANSPVENVHALVLRLFQDRVKLMKAPLHIQPPNGRTLVNLDTIFWTIDPTRTFGDIPVLDHRVDLRILPTSFAWHFGDGAQSETVTPGGPYPNKDVTHRYLSTGAVGPSLAVTYRGQYRIDDGAWTDMVGTATVDGPEVALTVVETRAQLIGG